MGKFTAIPEDAFKGLEIDAGILLYYFDVENATYDKKDIICATTGGINPSCTAEYSDFAEDVDNAQNNLMEFKHLDGWTCTFAFTSLGVSPKLIRLSLGAADIDSDNPSKIVPRRNVKLTDFTDIWWVGDRADGGMVAIQLKNALSTEGFSLQTTKNEKGQVSVTLTGHVSIEAQDVVPMVFYSADPPVETVIVTFNVDGGSDVTDQAVEVGGKVTKPADPTKDLFTFDGWYKDSAFTTAWDFDNDTVTENTTIYAKWTAVVTTYTVTFDSDGGTAIDPQTVEEGGKVTKPTDPTKGTDTFDGWYSDSGLTTLWDFDNDTVTGDTTLYAKWS